MKTSKYGFQPASILAVLLGLLLLLPVHVSAGQTPEVQGHVVENSSLDLQNANTIFRFLESQFSDILYPSQITQSTNGIFYRYYPPANLYLCVMNNTLYLLEDSGEIGVWHDLGTVQQWLDIIAGQPSITIHPQNKIMPDYLSIPPASVTFRVQATGIPPLTYQWQVSSRLGILWENIPGANDNTLTIYKFSDYDVDGLLFRCVVTGTYSSVPSISAFLTHSKKIDPSIVSHPGNQVMPDYRISPTPYVTFTVMADGTLPIHYQWQVGTTDANGVLRWTNINGATEASLRVYALTDLSTGGNLFRCRVNNIYGSTVSASARLNY